MLNVRNNKPVFGLIKKSVLGFLLFAQGIYVIWNNEFFNFGKGYSVSTDGYQYFVGFGLVGLASFIIVNVINSFRQAGDGSVKDVAELSIEKIEIPASLKMAIGYFLLYGAFTELLVVMYFDEWVAGIQGKSIAYIFGYLSKGPLLGIAFLISSYGLLRRKMWGRKLAVIALIFAIFAGAKGLSWGFSGGNPAAAIYVVSLIVIALWNCVWICLLYRPKINEILRG